MSQYTRKRPGNAYDVIVVGGGIFGVLTALEVAKKRKVLLIERRNDILMEASFVNQNRVHFGFHYPRSPQTAYQSLDGYEIFKEKFAPFMRNFANYYGIIAHDSLTTPEDYLKFAERLKINRNVFYKKVNKDQWFFNKNVCSLLLKVDEPVIDMEKVREYLREEVCINKNVKLITGKKAVSLESGNHFVVEIDQDKYVSEYLVNATYGNLCWHNYPTAPKVQIQYVEMVELESDKQLPGITMMDGPHCMGILPIGQTSNRYWWYSVAYSVHMRVETRNNVSFLPPFYSNWDRMKEQGRNIFSFMDDLKYRNSFFTPRVLLIDDHVDLTAARPSLIMKLGHNFYQILSGKLVTSVRMAKDMSKIIEDGCTDKVYNMIDMSREKAA